MTKKRALAAILIALLIAIQVLSGCAKKDDATYLSTEDEKGGNFDTGEYKIIDGKEYIVIDNTDYQYLRALDRLGCLVDQWQFEHFPDEPFTTEIIILSESNATVSVFRLQEYVFAYNIMNDEDLGASAEDIIALWHSPNEEVSSALEDLEDWAGKMIHSGGQGYFRRYYDFVDISYDIYNRVTGEVYAQKERKMLDAQEEADLVMWSIEHPDTDIINSYFKNKDYNTNNDEMKDEEMQRGFEYTDFLQIVDVINEYGTLKQSAAKEE